MYNAKYYSHHDGNLTDYIKNNSYNNSMALEGYSILDFVSHDGSDNKYFVKARKYNNSNELIGIADVTLHYHNNGKISSLYEDIYGSEEEYNSGVKVVKSINIDFDPVGNMLYHHEFHGDGSGYTTIRQEFDSSGKLTSRIEENRKLKDGSVYTTNTEGDGAAVSVIEVIEDLSGKLLSKKECTKDINDNVIFSAENKYNSRGELATRDTVTQEFDSKNKLDYKVELKQRVDSRGRLTSSVETKFDGDGKLISKVTIEQKYDIYGNLIQLEKKTYDANEKLIISIKGTQDFNYHRIKKSAVLITEKFGPNEMLTSRLTKEYKYNDDGKLEWRIESPQKFNAAGVGAPFTSKKYFPNGTTISFSGCYSPAKSDQLVSAINGFGILNRGPVIATDEAKNKASVKIIYADQNLSSQFY